MKVSVLLAAYKEPVKWLKKSIDSIVEQSYENIELIVVVDNPQVDKNVISLLDEYNERGLLNYFVNEENIGLAKSLNKAFLSSSGDYIARLDADDYSAIDRIEKQVEFLDKNSDIALVGTGIYQIDKDSKIIKASSISSDFELLKKKIYYSTIAYHPTWLIRREVFLNLNGYREYPAAQDTDFLLRLIEGGMKVSNIDEALVYYRVNDESISNKKSLLQRKCQFLILRHHKIRKSGKSDNYKRDIDNRLKSSMLMIKLHNLSQTFFIKSSSALSGNNKIKAGIFLLMSALLSPYQARHIARTIKFKVVNHFMTYN